MKRIECYAVIFFLTLLAIWPTTVSTQAQSEGWGTDTRLSFTENSSSGPAIAVWEDNIHVILGEDKEYGKNRYLLWYRNSTDGGDTWNKPKCLSTNIYSDVGLCEIAVNGSNIHVVWADSYDDKVHYIRSTDNGNNWSSEVILTPQVYLSTDTLDIAVYEDNVHVVYMDANCLFSYINSYDNGMSWNPPQVLATTYSPSTYTDIEVAQNTIHVVWMDYVLTPSGKMVSEMFYIKSMDNGITWGTIINITGTPLIRNHFVDMDIFGERIYIVYGHEEAVRQVYLSYSEDNGASWIRNINISDSTITTVDPEIAVYGDWVFVLWHSGGRIYYKSSEDKGSTWCNNTAFTNENQTSVKGSLQIIAEKNVFHIVWSDGRDGNYEVYYKRFIIPSMSVLANINIDPDTLNLKSKGKWITAYIELPEGYDVNDIDISTILLEDVIFAEKRPYGIGDHDKNGIPDLMVKFDRAEVEDLLTPSDSKALEINGHFFSGGSFKGNDSIKVILPP